MPIVALGAPLRVVGDRLGRHAWVLAAVGVALVAGRVYLASSNRALLDSKYALLTSEALLVRGDLDLAPYLPHLGREVGSEAFGGERRHRLPNQLGRHRGRLLYIYPPGTALLGVPGMWVARQVGLSTLTPDGRYSAARERHLQALFAAGLAALTVVVVHRIARRELPLPAATAVALAAAFASELWGTASRVLWSHSWAVLWIAVAWLELLRWEDGGRRRPGWLAAALGAAVWCRPATALFVAPATLFVASRHRRALPRLLAGGAVAALALAAYNRLVWGSWTSRYLDIHSPVLASLPPAETLFARLVTSLTSPEHGFVVLYPVALVVLAALGLHGVAPERRALAALAGFVVVAHLVFYGRFHRFWGGGTPGNRFLTEVAPLLAWLGAHAWRRVREAWCARPPSRLVRAVVAAATVLLVGAGAAAQAAGSLKLTWKRTDRARRAAESERGAPPRVPAPYWMRTPQAKLVVWIVREGWPAERARERRARQSSGNR